MAIPNIPRWPKCAGAHREKRRLKNYYFLREEKFQQTKYAQNKTTQRTNERDKLESSKAKRMREWIEYYKINEIKMIEWEWSFSFEVDEWNETNWKMNQTQSKNHNQTTL